MRDLDSENIAAGCSLSQMITCMGVGATFNTAIQRLK